MDAVAAKGRLAGCDWNAAPWNGPKTSTGGGIMARRKPAQYSRPAPVDISVAVSPAVGSAARSTEIGAETREELSVEEMEKADIMPTNHYA